jgi:mono/diheme cytochrome c family protein
MWNIDVKREVNRPGAKQVRGKTKGERRKLIAFACALCLAPFAFSSSACRQDMHDQPKYKPYAPSSFFDDGRASRPLVEGTVPRGSLDENNPLARAVLGEQAVGHAQATTFPFALTSAVLARGQERFNISCSPCHGGLGDGEGMIAKRGFRRPPSYHLDRLRDAPVGHFYDVITNGFGAMSSYADQVTPRDRWAIIAYIRALQLSQHARRADLPPEEWQKLQTGESAKTESSQTGKKH